MIPSKPLDILGVGGRMRAVLCLGILSIIFVISGCASNSLRVPASFSPKYDSKIVSSLKTAALSGVLFQVNDSVFRDVPARQVELCRKAEAPTWSAAFSKFLELLDRNPQYYNKFYIVDFKRGDRPRAEITKDIDGLTSLSIVYAKRENREKITPMTTLPCSESAASYLGKELITTLIDWPSIEQINTTLKEAPNKAKIDRFQFNTDFLIYLAERQTILKINPEVAFERTYQGEYFLNSWLEKMAEEIRDSNQKNAYINYWLKEISTRSNQAKSIQFFGLHSENRVSYGVQVDSVGKFNRKINSYQEPTYLFMSYREKNGEYIYSQLKDLDQCLQTLVGNYSSISRTYDYDGDSFLAPGYSCKLQGEE